jgi:hypothetical protein
MKRHTDTATFLIAKRFGQTLWQTGYARLYMRDQQYVALSAAYPPYPTTSPESQEARQTSQSHFFVTPAVRFTSSSPSPLLPYPRTQLHCLLLTQRIQGHSTWQVDHCHSVPIDRQ